MAECSWGASVPLPTYEVQPASLTLTQCISSFCNGTASHKGAGRPPSTSLVGSLTLRGTMCNRRLDTSPSLVSWASHQRSKERSRKEMLPEDLLDGSAPSRSHWTSVVRAISEAFAF